MVFKPGPVLIEQPNKFHLASSRGVNSKYQRTPPGGRIDWICQLERQIDVEDGKIDN